MIWVGAVVRRVPGRCKGSGVSSRDDDGRGGRRVRRMPSDGPPVLQRWRVRVDEGGVGAAADALAVASAPARLSPTATGTTTPRPLSASASISTRRFSGNAEPRRPARQFGPLRARRARSSRSGSPARPVTTRSAAGLTSPPRPTPSRWAPVGTTSTVSRRSTPATTRCSTGMAGATRSGRRRPRWPRAGCPSTAPAWPSSPRS